MKTFSDEWINRLNSTHSGGLFFKAAVLEVDDDTTLYFSDTQDPITFDGNVYTPLQMVWAGQETSAEMPLPSVKVTVPDINGAVGAFLETTSLNGRDVTLQLLHRDLLSVVTDVDTVQLQVMLIELKPQEAAVFTLGLNLALSDQLPKSVMTRAEYPGIPDAMRRASIL
jgi:hypothetical protein